MSPTWYIYLFYIYFIYIYIYTHMCVYIYCIYTVYIYIDIFTYACIYFPAPLYCTKYNLLSNADQTFNVSGTKYTDTGVNLTDRHCIVFQEKKCDGSVALSSVNNFSYTDCYEIVFYSMEPYFRFITYLTFVYS